MSPKYLENTISQNAFYHFAECLRKSDIAAAASVALARPPPARVCAVSECSLGGLWGPWLALGARFFRDRLKCLPGCGKLSRPPKIRTA